MLRITQSQIKNHVTILRLEGRVAGPWVAELSHACDRLFDTKRPIELNLAEVSYADQSGVSCLVKLRERGVGLRDATPFLQEQLKSADAFSLEK